MNKTIKHLRSTVLLAGVAIAGSSQTSQAQEVEYGFKVGGMYNMPKYSNKSVTDEKSNVGANLGGFVRVGQDFYIQPELNFTLMQNSFHYNQKAYNQKNYFVDLPIQLGYKIVDEKDFNLRAAVGPQGNYRLKTTNEVAGAENKRFGFEGFVNVGMDYKHLTLDVRYNHGLTTMNKTLDMKNRAIGLSVGYKF